MDEKTISFKKKAKALLICSIVFSVVYNFSAWYSSNLSFVPSFVFSFEKFTPFISWSIIPYLSSGILFCAVFLFCKSEEELNTLTKRILLTIGLAGICFLLFPLKFSLSKPEVENSFFQFLFQILQKIDSPYNQAPSLHIAFAFIFWSVFRNLRSKWRELMAFWLVLLSISTLTTFQHQMIDVFAGSILAHFVFIIVPAQQGNFKFRNFQLANYYFLAGWVFGLISLLLNEFFSSVWLILFWIAIMMFLLGFHYQNNSVHFLKDKNGKIPFYKKIFYFPYLMMYWLFWKFLRKNKKPIEIMPRIFISSRLDQTEILNFKLNENTFVYDFSAEMEEHSILRKKGRYFCFPLMDIGSIDELEIEKIISKISENYQQIPADGKILIHCTMGFTRSSMIGILIMKKNLSLPIEKAITLVKNRNPNAVISTDLQDFLKKLNL